MDGSLVLDIGQPRRVQPVQRAERAVRIPPFGGNPAELFDLGRIHGPLRGHPTYPKLARLNCRGVWIRPFAQAISAWASNSISLSIVARIVQKFGGTSVADIDRIVRVSHKIKAELDLGNQVAVVVSAMAGATNKLIELCSGVSPMFDAREYDTVVATGEQVTAGLTALALQKLGINARSWLRWPKPRPPR